MARFWASILWRAALSMCSSFLSHFIKMSTTASRLVFRSSMKSISLVSASLSVTRWERRFTFSRLKRMLQHQLSLSHQLVFDELEHFLVGCAALAHLVLVLIQNGSDLFVQTILEAEF